MEKLEVSRTNTTKNLKLNFFWQICFEVTNMLLPLVTSPILARRLGAESIGTYSYVYSISYYFIIIATLGMFQYGTREIAQVREDRNKLNERFSELLFSQILIGTIVLICFLTYIALFSKFPLLFLIETVNFLGSSLLLINWLFSGLEEFQTIAIKTMIIRIIGVILIVYCVQSPKDLPVYFLIMSAEPLAGAFVYIYLARSKVRIVKFRLSAILPHIKGMSLLFVPVLTTYLYSSMDKVMIGQMSTMTQLGFYENATKALIARNLATALSTVLIPRMSNLLGKNDNKQFESLLNKSLDAVFLLTVAFGFGTAAVSTVFSVVFWGDGFSQCGPLIMIMSLTIPAYGITYVINNQYLVPAKMERIYIWATTAGVVVNFIFNAVLIPKYAAMGAAVATLITQFIVLIVECFVIRKQLSVFKCLRKSVGYVAIGLIMIVVVKYIEEVFVPCSIIGLMIEIAVGVLIFSVLVTIYWIVTKQYQYLNIIINMLPKANI